MDLGSGAFGPPRDAGAAQDSGARRDASAAQGASQAPSVREAGTLAWRAGDRVRHRRFGDGIVVSSQFVKGDEEVTVAFVGQGVKRLIAEYAGLERA